jgi:hypothetical protein
MDYGEYLRGLNGQEVSLATQQEAQELLAEFQSSTHIDRAKETDESFLRALGKDLIDLTVAIPTRARTYKLHRDLGLSTFQALRHSSPVDGLVIAQQVAPNLDNSQ